MFRPQPNRLSIWIGHPSFGSRPASPCWGGAAWGSCGRLAACELGTWPEAAPRAGLTLQQQCNLVGLCALELTSSRCAQAPLSSSYLPGPQHLPAGPWRPGVWQARPTADSSPALPAPRRSRRWMSRSEQDRGPDLRELKGAALFTAVLLGRGACPHTAEICAVAIVLVTIVDWGVRASLVGWRPRSWWVKAGARDGPRARLRVVARGAHARCGGHSCCGFQTIFSSTGCPGQSRPVPEQRACVSFPPFLPLIVKLGF